MGAILDEINPSFPHVLIKRGIPWLILGLILLVLSLTPVPKVISGFLHNLGFYFSDVFISFILLVLGVITIVAALMYFYVYSHVTIMWLEPDKIVLQQGVIARQRKKIPLYKITDTLVKQGYMDRLIGSAKIYINTSGHPTYEIAIYDVEFSDAERFHDNVYSEIKKMEKELMEKESD